MKENLKNILQQFKNKKIVVWGDLILDEYVYTTTGRISREAPVLVTELEDNEFILGGAGNVVMNINSLGAIPLPVGFVDKGPDGAALKNLLREKSITTKYLLELDNYRTPKKSRILSGGEHTKKQQVLRIDTLNKTEIEAEAYEKIEAILSGLLEENDYLIISDYLCESVKADVFDKLRERFPAKCVIIDSRQNLRDFPGISIATPNEPEIKRLFPGRIFRGDKDFIEAGHELLNHLIAKGIILKLGHKGMIVFDHRREEPQPIAIHGSADIVDVTGAGDTVISVLSLALSTGADLLEASQLANIAAGFVVMKDGAYPIGLDELNHELNEIL